MPRARFPPPVARSGGRAGAAGAGTRRPQERTRGASIPRRRRCRGPSPPRLRTAGRRARPPGRQTLLLERSGPPPMVFASRETRITAFPPCSGRRVARNAGQFFLRPRADHSSSAESRRHLRPSRPSTSAPAGSSIIRSGAPPPPSEEGGISTQRGATGSARSVEEESAARSVCGQRSSSAERLRGDAIPTLEEDPEPFAKADKCQPGRL